MSFSSKPSDSDSTSSDSPPPSHKDETDASEEIFDSFLKSRGHVLREDWELNKNKKQCPDCGGLHDNTPETTECSSCGWEPTPTPGPDD